MLIIKSNYSDQELYFSDLEENYFRAGVRGSVVTTDVKVYAPSDNNGVGDLFDELSKLNKPWIGEKTWQSIEGEFKISFACDDFGHVSIDLKFRNFTNFMNEIKETCVFTSIEIDFGALHSIGGQAQKFFV